MCVCVPLLLLRDDVTIPEVLVCDKTEQFFSIFGRVLTSTGEFIKFLYISGCKMRIDPSTHQEVVLNSSGMSSLQVSVR